MSNMSVVDVIKHYQRSIEKCQGNHERMLHCISKLYRLPVTVQHLQDTGIGRTVNNLRKYEGDTGEAAKALVAKWKAMVAAEDSSEGENQEENHENSVEEEEEQSHKQDDHHRSNKHRSHDREKSQHKEKTHHEKDRSHHDRDRSYHDKEKSQHSRERSHHDRDRSQHEKEKSHHNKKHDDERSKKSSSHEQNKKRKYEEENRNKSEKRRRKHETESESSESENDSTGAEEDDSGHDSEAQSTSQASQTSQNVDEDSSDEESPPPPQKHKNHSTKEHSSKGHSSSSSKGHSSRSTKEHGNSKDHSSHRKDKERSKHKTENSNRKDEKRKEENSKKQKSSSHIPEKKHSTKIKKEKSEAEDGSIDCSTGASFAEALGMVDPVVKKKPHTSTSSPSTSSTSRGSKSSSTPKKKDVSSRSSPGELNLLAPNVKLEPLEVDLDATLPAITPNYKPLPHYNLLDSSPHRKVKQISEEEALSQVMSTKNQRTKVYSGVKSGKSWATVPTLYDICVRVLQENIDALEYTGGVPYDLLKPVLQHANPEQLFMLEHHNPYLIDDTDELWKFHCQKQFRTKQRLDMETSREMYLRCLDEREAKLKALTTNIQQSIAKSTPVRQTKLAYVDSVAKPPRNVARQQAKYGTAVKVSKPSPAAKATVKAHAVAASVSATATPVPPPRTFHTVSKQKPRMAPLMQKTMKLVKSFKR